MRGYYGIDSIQFGNIPGDGRGMTIAVVEAFDDPSLQADLNAFDQQYNLPATTITKYSQIGSTALTAKSAVLGDWGIESSLDVEWSHVMAPLANIIVVEGNSAIGSDLYAAAQIAATLPNVAVVSMSFGGSEFGVESLYDSKFITPTNHSNVTFVASTGDSGSPGEYPAMSPNVVAVGGTTFTLDSNQNIAGEMAWSGSGGGTSAFESQPSYQNGFQTTGQRTTPDVAMDAGTGVAIYDSYDLGIASPWGVYGGTSLSAPMFAGVIAVADQGRVQNSLSRLDGLSQTLPLLYGLNGADFHDIVSGSNGAFDAVTGYDEVTGRGSPVGSLLPNDLAGIAPSVPTINDSTAGDTITLRVDPNQRYIDWTTSASSGQFAITNPAGLKIVGTGNTIHFNYTNGNPMPALLSLSGTLTLTGLQGTNPLAGTKLDINSSTLFLTYTPGSDPTAAIQQYLRTGYNGGLWNGTPAPGSGSITSTTAALDTTQLHGIGYVDNADGSQFNTLPNSIELRYTLYGDTSLSGAVGFADFMRLTQHYGLNSGGAWDTGDFNYDGSIGSVDFGLLSASYGLTLSTPVASPPASTPTVTDPTPSTGILVTTAGSRDSRTAVNAIDHGRRKKHSAFSNNVIRSFGTSS